MAMRKILDIKSIQRIKLSHKMIFLMLDVNYN